MASFSMNRYQAVNLAAVFLILLGSLTIATLIKPQDQISEVENRTLKTRPKLTFSSLISGEFAEDYEAYLSDQFIGRNKWITFRTGFERAIGKTEISDVFFAKDDYLIEKHSGVFSGETAASNITILSEFARKVSSRFDSQHFTVMLVPNAVDILRDKLPYLADPYDEEIYLDRISQVLPEGVWLDLSSVLRAHKEEEIYYRTDHHWKTLGAFWAFRAFQKKAGLPIPEGEVRLIRVSGNFQGTIASKLAINGKADSIERYDPNVPLKLKLVYNEDPDTVRDSIYDASFLEKKDKYSYFYGGNFGRVRADIENGSDRRLLILKDSYAHCFVPFSYDCFSRVDMVDLRYYINRISDLIENGGYTDICLLYNAAGFAGDTSIARLLT